MKLFAKMLTACLLLYFTVFAGTAGIALEKNEGRTARVLRQGNSGFRVKGGTLPFAIDILPPKSTEYRR